MTATTDPDSELDAVPVLRVRQTAGRAIFVLVVGRVAVGRDCDGVILLDTRTSRRHAEFFVDSTGQTHVVDLASSNGTFVNGVRIADTMPIGIGDTVRLGNTEIEVVPSAAVALGATDDSATNQTTLESTKRPDQVKSSIIELASSVGQELAAVQDSVHQASNQEGTITVVFSDIESSTERATSLGDEQWMLVLGAHNRILREALHRHQGIEIKSQGDGFMLSFASARRATDFAIDAQRAIAEFRAVEPELGVRIRLGVHCGDAVHLDGDLFGRHVIIASRIADQAGGDQIFVSGIVRELIAGKVGLDLGPANEVDLKGIGPQVIHELHW